MRALVVLGLVSWLLAPANAVASQGQGDEPDPGLGGVHLHVIALMEADATELAAVLREILVTERPLVKVVADVATNCLVVVAPPRDFDDVKAIVAQLDKPRTRVLLEALLLEVPTGDVQDPRGTALGDVFVPPFGFVSDAVRATLATSDDPRIVARESFLVVDGARASARGSVALVVIPRVRAKTDVVDLDVVLADAGGTSRTHAVLTSGQGIALAGSRAPDQGSRHLLVLTPRVLRNGSAVFHAIARAREEAQECFEHHWLFGAAQLPPFHVALGSTGLLGELRRAQRGW
jgi:hypothetical protein